jgi:hypothetical protein
MDYNDLKKIMEDISLDKSGKLNFYQFCKWMGPTIQDIQSLNFRHDSSINPEFV